MTTSTTKNLDVYRSSQLENILRDEYGWTFTLDEVDLSLIDVMDDQQVRDIAHVADPERVKEYAEAMKAGATLPAVVLRAFGDRYILTDGNTRRGAHVECGYSSIPAYIVNMPSGELARELATRLNQMHGARMTEDEARREAELMIDNGRPDDAIMRVTGMKAPKVREWRTEAQAIAHAKKVDVAAEMQMISPTQRRIIGSRVKLDQPFAEVVKLAAKAKIPNSELRSIADEIAGASAESDMVGVVEKASMQYAPVGKGEKAQVVVNQKAKRMRMVLPQVLNLAPPADVYEGARAADDREMWAKVFEVASRMITFYDQMGVTPAPIGE